MVYFYESRVSEYGESYNIVTGKDKFENDFLIKYSFKELNYVWFHADKYSSGHIYLQLKPTEKTWEDVPDDVINDCLQLCKASSIQGNKMDQCTILITPWTNLRKNKFMKPGEVSFKSLKNCRRKISYNRDNNIINRLTKTRIEIFDNVEALLHGAKKSKNYDFLNNYITENAERLIEEEKTRKIAKKQKKKIDRFANNEEN